MANLFSIVCKANNLAIDLKHLLPRNLNNGDQVYVDNWAPPPAAGIFELQKWELLDLPSIGGAPGTEGWCAIRSWFNPMFYLNAEVSLSGEQPGRKVQIWMFDEAAIRNAAENWWRFELAEARYYRIRQWTEGGNEGGGMILNAEGPNPQPWNKVQLYPQTGGDNELWRLEPA